MATPTTAARERSLENSILMDGRIDELDVRSVRPCSVCVCVRVCLQEVDGSRGLREGVSVSCW